MRIQFMGGARTVTGSCYILYGEDYNIMIEAGMFQGTSELSSRNHDVYKHIDLSKIDCLLLSHAHIDHSGLIPKLVREGFRGKIFSTRPTIDLCTIMLADSAHIQEMDIKHVNKKNKRLGRDEVKPLYSIEDAGASMKHFIAVDYDNTIDIHPGVKVRFRDAGHILGSSIIEIWAKNGANDLKIVFSGDLGPKEHAILKDPAIVDEADVLLIESTYGDRLHKSKADTYREFAKIISVAHNSNGNIIIPAFAIERTQEIIYTLSMLFKNNEIPKIPVYIDSPLAISATEIFRRHKECFDVETMAIFNSGDNPLDFPTLKFSRTRDESIKLNTEARGAIIISANGMCTAGRIKHHLQNNLYRPESSIVFVGYQAEGTLGRRLIEGAKQVRVYGKEVKVNASIHTLGGFSAHADKNCLLEWLSMINNPKLKVFVIHGEENSALAFAETIRTIRGCEATVPEWGQSIDLHNMNPEVRHRPVTEYDIIDVELGMLETTLTRLKDRLNSVKTAGRPLNIRKITEDIIDAKEMMNMVIDDM